jgi:GT2 family glycosyltransferase
LIICLEITLIDVIIPNWNGRKYLKDCLDSLRRQTYQSFSVTIVDNGSTDDSVRYLHEDYPEVKVIALEMNRGFAGGVNEGIKNADAELIFLLNNDTVVDKNCLSELYKAAVQYPQMSFFATKMLFKENTKVLNAAGDSFGIDGWGRNIGIRESDYGQYDQVIEVFGACAGAALYRRSFFQDVGLFDEDFFLILEDIDVDFRARWRGHRCYYIPSAVVYHVHSASIVKHSSLQIYHNARNSLYVLAKNMPAILLVKYFWRIFWQRQRFVADSIIHEQILPLVRGEIQFLLTILSVAGKRLRIHLDRRVTTQYINSILVDPKRRG